MCFYTKVAHKGPSKILILDFEFKQMIRTIFNVPNF